MYELRKNKYDVIEQSLNELEPKKFDNYKVWIIRNILDEDLNIIDKVYLAFIGIMHRLTVYYTSKNLSLKSNDLYLILQTFGKMINKLIQESNKNILYNVINQSYKIVISNENFKLDYLEIFNEYLLNIAKMIIEKNDLELFKELIGNFTDPEIYKLDSRDMYNFAYSYMSPKSFVKRKEGCSPEQKTRDLCESTFKIFLKQDVDLWKEKFAELEKLYVKNSNKAQNEISQISLNAQNIKKKILNSLHEECKANNLKLMFMFLGAICVRERKVHWIKELWTHTHPPDADCISLNQMPVPQNLEQADLEQSIVLYLKTVKQYDRVFKSTLRSGFSGLKKYINQYFILLLVKLLVEKKVTDPFSNFLNLDVHELYELKNHCEALSKEAENMKSNLEFSKLFDFKKYIPSDSKQNNLSEDLVESDIIKEEKDDRSNDQRYTDFINDDIPRLFKEISSEIDRRIVEEIKSKSITKKANSFKKEFTDYIKELNTIKNLMINYFKAYDNQTKTVKLSEKPRGLILHSFYDKIFFLDNWPILCYYVENICSSVAQSENRFLLKKIKEKCSEKSEEKFDGVIGKFKDKKKLVIIASNQVFHNNEYFFDIFKSSWDKRIDINIPEDLRQCGFSYYYNYDEDKIPVKTTSLLDDENIVLVLNKEKFGKLYQYKIVDETGHEHEDFYIDIKTCDQQFVEQQLKSDPPDWFKKMNKKEQIDHTSTRVALKIFEKLEFKFSDDEIWRARSAKSRSPR